VYLKEMSLICGFKNINLSLNIITDKSVDTVHKQARSQTTNTMGAAASSARVYIAH